MADSTRPAFPLRLKLGLLAALLATTPLPVVGFVLIAVAQGAIEHQSREVRGAASKAAGRVSMSTVALIVPGPRPSPPSSARPRTASTRWGAS